MLQSATSSNIDTQIDCNIIEGAIIDVKYTDIINPPLKEDTFGQRLRKSRLEANISISEVANLCGITKSVVDGYELNRHYPSIEILNKLSEHFNLTYLCKDGYTKLLIEHDIFIERLNNWIEENNLTKQQAADKLGISRGLLRFWFNGSIISSSTYKKIRYNLEKYNLL